MHPSASLRFDDDLADQILDTINKYSKRITGSGPSPEAPARLVGLRGGDLGEGGDIDRFAAGSRVHASFDQNGFGRGR
jgi:hypothetical protein